MATSNDTDLPANMDVTSESLVTEAHVTAALKADKGIDAILTSWSIKDFTKRGDNFACVVTSVKVKFSLHQQISRVIYIVKINPCRQPKECITFSNVVFQKEAKFYLDLVVELNSALKEIGQTPLQFPKCLYAYLEENREVIFLEDLRPVGFKMFDRRQGLDVAHTTLILKELARLHAASCLLQDKTPNQDLPTRHTFLKVDSVKDMEFPMNFVKTQIILCNELLAKIRGYDRVIYWAESILQNISQIFDEHLTGGKYSVVCHGDCWNNNVLFKYSDDGHPVEVMLVDLQINRWASPATDLNYLIYTSLTGEVRKANLEAFLTTYHTAFTTVMEAAGKEPIFTLDQLRQEFRNKNIIGAIFSMAITPAILLEVENVPNINSRDNDNLSEVWEGFRKGSLELLDTNPLFRSRLLSLFDEFIECDLIC